MKMNARFLAYVVMAFLCVIYVGCKSVAFEYPNKRCKINKLMLTNKPKIKVLPIVDMREDKSSTEGWSILAMLPLVPYVSFHNYDLEGYNADVGEFNFNMLDEVHDAVISHLNLSGTAIASKILNVRNKSDMYSMEVRLHKIGIEGCRTRYCLGLWPGCYLGVLGVPNTYANMMIDIEIVIRDSKNKIILQQRYDESMKYKVGMYYNWNCLKFLGICISKAMNKLCSDMLIVFSEDHE